MNQPEQHNFEPLRIAFAASDAKAVARESSALPMSEASLEEIHVLLETLMVRHDPLAPTIYTILLKEQERRLDHTFHDRTEPDTDWAEPDIFMSRDIKPVRPQETLKMASVYFGGIFPDMEEQVLLPMGLLGWYPDEFLNAEMAVHVLLSGQFVSTNSIGTNGFARRFIESHDTYRVCNGYIGCLDSLDDRRAFSELHSLTQRVVLAGLAAYDASEDNSGRGDLKLAHDTALRFLAQAKRERALLRWKAVRATMLTRNVAFYWQEETQKQLCAPGGRGRKRDRLEFEAEFGA